MLPPSIRALVRNVPTVAPIPRRSVLSVTGSQATEFLNGLVASSIPANPQSHFYTAFLHAQGRVLYDVFLYAHTSATGSQGYLVEYDSTSAEAPPLLPMLKRYMLRSKVKLRDVSDEYDVWASWGSENEKAWETERQWKHARSGAVEPVWDYANDSPWGTEKGMIRDRRAIGMGHRLIVRKGDKPKETATHDVASPNDYLLHRILRGVPEGAADITPMQAFPIDSNLDMMGALDFRKGCYIGQELTVRTYHTGIVRKRILPVVIHSPGDASRAPVSHLTLCSNLDIKARATDSSNGAVRKPRHRATGKILSSVNGIGLALLRLEHLPAVENGNIALEIETVNEDRQISELTHWLPDWWPPAPAPLEQES